MRTKILKKCDIKTAAQILKKGGLVAFPTETVYGLGANAFNPRAVKKIFAVKGRPSDNPLIVHIAKREQIVDLVKNITPLARRLIKKFWPGPLTIVLPKGDKVPAITAGGLSTIAVRVPSNPIARSLLLKAGFPIAAPSANKSGSPSPTCAEHVYKDLNTKIEAILDGGQCTIGLESTVVDCTGDVPVLLRPGAIGLEELKKNVDNLIIYSCANTRKNTVAEKIKSPGIKYKHYATDAYLVIVTGADANEKIKSLKKEYERMGKKVGIITKSSPDKMAKKLFMELRALDEKKVDIILAPEVSERGIGLAVMNRLRKASDKIV